MVRVCRWFRFAAAAALWFQAAASHAYAPRPDGAAIPSSPPADVVAPAEALGELRFTLDPRIGFFAAGDPINQLDPDGRFNARAQALQLSSVGPSYDSGGFGTSPELDWMQAEQKFQASVLSAIDRDAYNAQLISQMTPGKPLDDMMRQMGYPIGNMPPVIRNAINSDAPLAMIPVMEFGVNASVGALPIPIIGAGPLDDIARLASRPLSVASRETGWASFLGEAQARLTATKAAYGNVEAFAMELPRVHPVAPDWVTKGVHITAGGVELKVLPGQGGSIIFKPVFSSVSPSEASAAIRQAEMALKNPEFRSKLVEQTTHGIEYLGSSGPTGAAAKSGELHFLLKALEKQ